MTPKEDRLTPVAIAAVVAIGLASVATVHAQDLWVDFNSTSQDGGPHNQSGYQPYDAGHENAADFAGARTYDAFGTTVSLTVDFPDTSDPRVQQMIDRGGNNDGNWDGQKIDLLTDWLGVDTRTNNGGNGNYNGNTGSPTRMTLTLGGLPAGTYQWLSYHHDTEHVHGSFEVELSTDGGGSFADVGTFQGTDSTPGGNPDSGDPQSGSGNQDPATLDSTVTTDFTATGGDVVFRFTPLSGGAVHTQLMTINGFEVASTAPPTGPTDISLTNNTVSKAAAVGTTVGTLSTTDPTPGDSFTYSLVNGAGAEHNGFFEVTGADLRTNSELDGFAGGAVLTVRVRSEDAEGAGFEKPFSLTLVNDADDDGLDDDWELMFFPNIGTATGGGDNDGDSLTNLQEQSRGTDPTDGDSDDDGLGDNVETGTGVYVSPVDTGSDPLVADSDNDGIGDGEEVDGGNGSLTDPNKGDTDGDGFPDNIEIAEGTDPTNGGDFPNTLLPLRLNEILANNTDGLRDGFNNTEDWIEIYNPNGQPVNLDGYFLTDDAEFLNKWNFPEVSVPANGFLVVIASGRDTTDGSGNVHTSFGLDAGGEFLAIVRPNGNDIDHQFAPEFPKQFPDISYGLHPTDGSIRFFDTPTPGAANNNGFDDVVRDTTFSIDRGFYDEPFTVEITSLTPGATIRYTLDGTKPSETQGTVYTAPVAIDTTATLRAIAYKAGALSTNVDTHTYLFLDDVAQQPADPPGWPTDWGFESDAGAVVPSDYEMDPRVVNNTLPGYSIREALLDIPTVSLVMPLEHFVTDRSNEGIYSNSQERWERECSMEYILPDGSTGFQNDVEIEVHGNASRRPARMQKHSLRLTFHGDLGLSRLNYPLFPQTDNDEFNKLVLRACFTDSWGLVSWGTNRYRPNDSQYIRDVWMKESLRAMGQPSSAGNFVHVYVNGLYFGLHNLTERLEDDFFAINFGGEKEDWEINKDLTGGGRRWSQMVSAANGATTLAGYENLKQFLDVENFADYMLLHFYADSEDWPHHNGYAAVNEVSGDGRYRFWVWDQEIVLDKFSWNRYDDSRGPGQVFQRLRRSEEFRTVFADRVHKHMFNGGAISLEGSTGRYLEIAGWIDKAIVAESARWGDVQDKTPYGNRVDQPRPLTNVDHDAYPPAPHAPSIYFTREDSWIVERDNVVNHYIPTLHDETNSRSIIRELRSENLYPSIDAPQFNQHGGNVPRGFLLQVNGESGDIYLTTDGSDPRLPGGAVNPVATVLPTGAVTETVLGYEANGWRYWVTDTGFSSSDVVFGAAGYGPGDWKHPDFSDGAWPEGQAMLGYGGVSGSTVNQVIGFGPDGANKFPTTYFRKEVNITDAATVTGLRINIKRDDGAIVYLNGREVARSNFLEGATVNYSTTAENSSGEGEVFDFTYTPQPGDLIEGRNLLAVEVHQASGNSSDLGIDVQVVVEKPNTGNEGITLDGSTLVKARILAGGEWSALTEAFFNAGDLAVTEIMYRPAGDARAEFLELTNTGAATVSLEGLRFIEGIEFDFADSALSTLGAGERLLLVRDEIVFRATYGNTHDAIIAGEFGGGTALSNDGETLTLVDQNDTVILTFTYNDRAPWPEPADGDGPSLVLVAPGGDTDPGNPINWRPSTTTGGNPGASDATAFSGDALADSNGNGVADLVDYFLGSTGPGGVPIIEAVADTDGSFTVAFIRKLGADDATHEVEYSTAFDDWSSDPSEIVYVGSDFLDGGFERLIYTVTPPDGAETDRLFVRVRVMGRL